MMDSIEVDEFADRVLSHFLGCAIPEIRVGASENPFRRLLAEDEAALRGWRWICRRAPSREVADAVLARLGRNGARVREPDGWGFVYAFKAAQEKF